MPHSVLHIRPDTIGDLVIFLPALARMQAAWPEARHTLLVRPGYEALAPLFPPTLNWEVTTINPFRQRPSECRKELATLGQGLATLQPDLILASALNRTWLEAGVASHFPEVRSVVLGEASVDPIFAAALRIDLGVDEKKAFSETVPVDDNERDWENQHRFVDHLLGQKGPRPLPEIAVPAAAAAEADTVLAGKNLSGAWAAVFAGGLANVPVKAWTAERFGELVAWLQRERRMPALLLGHIAEKAMIESVAAAAASRGIQRPEIWLGQDGELPLLAGLLQKSRLYVGHDTGAMHLAAAVGRPVVGIFGGGHWPRFRAAARQGVSVVQPLPCFKCNWDCHFGDGPCVKTLTSADVGQGVDAALGAADQPIDRVIEAHNLPDVALRLIAGEVPRYAALQRDRLERQHKIEELKREADSKDEEIGSLKQETDFKDGEIASLKQETDVKDGEIASLKKETDFKDGEIAGLKKETDFKDGEIASLKQETDVKDAEIADLKKETDGKDGEIASLKKEADVKDGEIDELKATCNEREALIFQQDGHIKTFQKMVAELNAAHAEKDRQLARLGAQAAAAEAEKARVEAILAKLPPDAPTWADQFSAKDVHIQNIENLVAHHKRELVEREAAIANYVGGYHGLELAKHYGRLLAEKEAVMQTLNRACIEREAIIKQLTAEAAGPAARVRKLWIAASAHLREKWWRPFDAWLFRKTVEEYWMQIGVLRHYEPRPISWDRRLPKKPRLPEARLPQIGIVTPSFQQATFIESTMLSVLDQNYPKLLYVVQDGGSSDASPAIIARHAGRLRAWESAPDQGQGDAIRKGFARLEPVLQPDDVMAYLNSDDFIAPRALRFVGEYFASHPGVDVIYGHRIIIDGEDREVGRWVMPRHDPAALEWIDYVPQETLFWRKRAWDLAGGIDPSYHFALDWDLLARFQRAGCRMVRLPYFLGCFRVHEGQKTHHAIHTTGAEEMSRVRARFNPGQESDFATIDRYARKTRFRGALDARLLALGVRW
jgi:ADP-heptose:LPS heptosyltransferase